MDTELLEELAELEHEQWMKWAANVVGEVCVTRFMRWDHFMVPYSELDEETKDQDREWAKRVLVIVDKYIKRGDK